MNPQAKDEAPNLLAPPTGIVLPGPHRLRLLSFNIQVGINTVRGHHYLTRAWRHALPRPDASAVLDPIADLLRGYDFVAIQEGDAGSLRTLFRNQIKYLAERAGFAHWGLTVTRDLRPIAQHCLGFLSRNLPASVKDHVLPSAIPGRGAMEVKLGPEAGGVHLMIAHLSLGSAAQRRQLDYLSALVQPGQPTVLMGDFNCDQQLLCDHPALLAAGFLVDRPAPATFPSWAPRHAIDHILTTPEVDIHSMEALPQVLSDHRALAAAISVPSP